MRAIHPCYRNSKGL